MAVQQHRKQASLANHLVTRSPEARRRGMEAGEESNLLKTLAEVEVEGAI